MCMFVTPGNLIANAEGVPNPLGTRTDAIFYYLQRVFNMKRSSTMLCVWLSLAALQLFLFQMFILDKTEKMSPGLKIVGRFPNKAVPTETRFKSNFGHQVTKRSRIIKEIGIQDSSVFQISSVLKKQKRRLKSRKKSTRQKMNRSLLRYFKLPKTGKRDSLLNLHQFRYSLNSPLCENKKVSLVTFVHSKPNNHAQRAVIRDSFGAVKSLKNRKIVTVFMIGQTGNHTLQAMLEAEANKYRDLVQGNFLDSYGNLTYKHIMAYNWVLSNCHQAKFVLKIDEDTMINIYNLMDYILSVWSFPDLLYCSVLSQLKPFRSGKWKVAVTNFPFEVYPKYCQGFGYLATTRTIDRLYNATKNAKFLWIDDVYVTGILTLVAGVKKTDTTSLHDYMYEANYDGGPSVKNITFLIVKTNRWYQHWKAIENYTAKNRFHKYHFVS